MYCPRCGTKLPDIAKFCTKCGRPLPRHAEPTRDASSEIPSQVKSPLAISGTAESAQPSVEPPPPTLTQPMEVVPTPAEQPRVLVLKVPLDLPGLSGRAGLYLIGAGVLTVLVAFFLSWFHVSSPIANVFLGGLATLDFSGLVILGGFPDLGIPGSPAVVIIPLLALGILTISAVNHFKPAVIGQGIRMAQIGLAVLGIVLMIALLWLNQTIIDEMFQQIGIPGIVGQKIYSFEPAVGFWLTLLGFALALIGASQSWRRGKK